MTASPFSLQARVDPATGQLLALRDAAEHLPILAYDAGCELLINDVPLHTRLVDAAESRGEHHTRLRGGVAGGYGAGANLHIRRVISRGMTGLRPGKANSVHIRYEVSRVPMPDDAGEAAGYIWPPALEAPVQLDAVTVLAAPTRWFGEATHMRALAIGGTGPRGHVSYEDGPVAEIMPWLQSGFRTEFPGQATVAGALYYHREDHRWVWIMVRRPTTTGRVIFGESRHAYRFGYHMPFAPHEEVFTPAVSIHWGQGLEQAEAVLAEQFDLYEEPPDWAWHTTWFWLHPAWTRGLNYDDAAEGARILMEECGVNGFGLMAHDVPLSGNDVDVGSPAPSPCLGGDAGVRRLMDTLREGGAHSYAWISRHGHRPDSLTFENTWAIRGIDGRPIRLRNQPDHGVTLDIIDPADPAFQAYMRRWIEYYVRDLGITGLFWDSGFQPIPPDFGNKPYLRWPGQANALAAEFYHRMLRFGRSLSADFFMWAEGISVDMPMNGFSVDAKSHGGHSAHRLMHRLAHLGPRRLMWRSAWPHDVASGFTMLQPANDVGLSADAYRAIARHPMNQWICKTVRERGTRHAVGLADGVSRLDEFVIACPGAKGRVTVPDAPGQCLRHVISGGCVRGETADGGVCFELPSSGAYEFH